MDLFFREVIMTLSVLVVLITILCILYGLLKYYEWVELKNYYYELNRRIGLVHIYKDYMKKVKKYPELKKYIKIIEKILKGE